MILGHVGRRSRITVHGDYDVDGITSTAILVRALRTLGADVDWYLPSRIDDGYGLAAATVERLAARGTHLLVTVDCAITAVDEVAAARAAGMDVVVTDHHAPRADGALPDAPIVHPRIGGYPCPDLCAAGVAYKLAQALLAGAGEDPEAADEDLDLVALATVADVVSLTGENRRLVRAGLRRLAGTRKPGLQALMDVARVDPSGVDESAIGFRLAPRLNAAGRLYRADAGLELLLTPDPERAREIALELDAVNAERRDVETRIRFEAEALLAEQSAPGAPGARARRRGLAPGRDRHRRRPHRRAPLPPDRPDRARRRRGLGLRPLDPGLRPARRASTAGSDELLRYGGHRAAAGLTIARNRIDAFREAFVAHAAAHAHPRGPRPPRADRRRRARRRPPPRAGRGARAPQAVRHGQPRRLPARPRRPARRPAPDGGGPPRRVLPRRRRRPLPLRPVRRRQLPAVRARRAGRRRGEAGGQPLQRRHRAPPAAARGEAVLRSDRRDRRAQLEHRL